jgi:hypothetical protein
VISRTTAKFRAAFDELPADVQRSARRAYRLFLRDPNHPSLRFKPVHPTQPIFSARISGGYRAVCIAAGEEIVWFWIGTHAAYERLLAKRRPKG